MLKANPPKSEPVSERGRETFISKILGEMKNQFNKSKPDKKCETTETDCAKVCSHSSQEVKLSTDDFEKSSGFVSESVDDASEKVVLYFKKPNSEPPSPGKRFKTDPSGENIEESSPKRSSRRRSKDCKESVLQSAIARKVKSYNESNKPQRLSRQLKPTSKILENIAFAKQEKKCKLQTIFNSNNSEENKSIKRTKNNVCEKDAKNQKTMESDDDEISSDSEVTIKNTQKSRRVSAAGWLGDDD